MLAGRESREERVGYEKNECKGRLGEYLRMQREIGCAVEQQPVVWSDLLQVNASFCGELSHVAIHTPKRKPKEIG